MDKEWGGRFGHVSKLRSILDDGGWWHSFELPDGNVIQGANSLDGLRQRIAYFPIAEDLRGKRVLDIGTWDGWFAFEMERRGADVMAVDVIDSPRFREIHRIYQSRIDYRQMDVYDLTPAKVGQFDIVLFMGVFYHLKHPLLGLERVCALATEMAAVDSFVLQDANSEGAALDRPVLEFFETDEFGGQVDNWVAPNVPCLLAMCRTAGFPRVELRNVGEYGASVACFRKWEAGGAAGGDAPRLSYLAHHMNFGINFDGAKDEYVTAWFEHPAAELRREDVRPSVGSYGVLPIMIKARKEGEWETSFRIPPGLTPGWHDVKVRIGDGPASHAMQIAVDVPLLVERIRVRGLRDGADWTAGKLRRATGNAVSMWLEGLPENADVHNLRVMVEGRRMRVTYIEPYRPDERQVNFEIPGDVPGGAYKVSIQIGYVAAESSVEIV